MLVMMMKRKLVMIQLTQGMETKTMKKMRTIVMMIVDSLTASLIFSTQSLGQEILLPDNESWLLFRWQRWHFAAQQSIWEELCSSRQQCLCCVGQKKEMRKKGREGKVREATNKETERAKESLLVREAVEKNTVENNTVDRRWKEVWRRMKQGTYKKMDLTRKRIRRSKNHDRKKCQRRMACVSLLCVCLDVHSVSHERQKQSHRQDQREVRVSRAASPFKRTKNISSPVLLDTDKESRHHLIWNPIFLQGHPIVSDIHHLEKISGRWILRFWYTIEGKGTTGKSRSSQIYSITLQVNY